MPAWSRCTSWPLILTTRLRFRSSNCWSITPPCAGPRRPDVASGASRSTAGTRRGGPRGGVERGRPDDVVVPVPGPDAVGRPRTRRPREHRLEERHAECLAEERELRARILEDVAGIDHGGHNVRLTPEPLEDLDLLRQAGI